MRNEPVQTKLLPEMNGTWHVLQVGSGSPGVRSSVSLIVDHDQLIVVDPGMAPSQSAISGPLLELGFEPGQITDVVISHHHPDHTVNVGMFPHARVHDHWAVYHGAAWDSVDAEGRELTPSLRLIRVPGHTPEDIALVAGTPHGIVVLTHLWWTAEGPADDPYAPDRNILRSSRERVLALADMVVPGHGPMFTPSTATPR